MEPLRGQVLNKNDICLGCGRDSKRDYGRIGQLYGISLCGELARRLADQALERAGQVGLVGIARPLDGIEDRYSSTQQGNGMMSTFDLVDGAVRQASGV